MHDANGDDVEKALGFLQSRDNDSDVYNGIVISAEVRDAFTGESFDLVALSSANLLDALSENGLTTVSEDDAMIHVNDIIMEQAVLSEFDERES